MVRRSEKVKNAARPVTDKTHVKTFAAPRRRLAVQHGPEWYSDVIARCIVEEVIRLNRFTKASQIKAALEKEIAKAKKRGIAQAG